MTEKRNVSGKGLAAIPRGVWALGFASLFMDMSSELIHSLLPVFLATGLGVSMLAIGVIEGLAEAVASMSKVFSGAISDWMGKRKPLLLLGYGLAALSKPLFPMAYSVSAVLIARLMDRVGKGIRGAPRDALVADITPVSLRGAAYGLRQSMDTVGAFAGPALALLLMAVTHDDFRLVFWIAVIPAFVCVAIILFGIREPEAVPIIGTRRVPIQLVELKSLPLYYWLLVGFAAVLTLARFSEAFLLLRAENVGLAVALVPLILIVMNVVYAASAYPFGHFSDRMSRGNLLGYSISFLIISDLILALAENVWWVIVGAMFWGLHMGASQGLLSALVADVAPASLRGTAFGFFHLATGVSLLLASVLAGGLWSIYGPAATFYAGAGFSLLALSGLLLRKSGRRKSE